MYGVKAESRKSKLESLWSRLKSLLYCTLKSTQLSEITVINLKPLQPRNGLGVVPDTVLSGGEGEGERESLFKEPSINEDYRGHQHRHNCTYIRPNMVKARKRCMVSYEQWQTAYQNQHVKGSRREGRHWIACKGGSRCQTVTTGVSKGQHAGGCIRWHQMTAGGRR